VNIYDIIMQWEEYTVTLVSGLNAPIILCGSGINQLEFVAQHFNLSLWFVEKIILTKYSNMIGYA